MKRISLALFIALTLSSCGGGGFDTQTLAGTYTGTWSNEQLHQSGALNLAFSTSGVITGDWQDPNFVTPFTINSSQSSFNGTSVKIRVAPTSSFDPGEFRGTLLRNGNHLSGVLMQKGIDVDAPYPVSLDITP